MGPVFDSCTESDYKLLVQQRCGWTSAKGRLRREDCKFVKHDKLFSEWKILMSASEETNSTGMKDGTWKYHIHNLPVPQFRPGVYEIGVTAPFWSKAPNSQTLKREDVIAVYIGQAANIPRRLQKYGLQAACSRSFKLLQGENDLVQSRSPRMVQKGLKGAKSPQSAARLFSEAFALGSSIVFRWAHTDSKVVAERVTSELLAVFDYAWNRGTSGGRRSRDILAKLLMDRPRNKPTSRFRILIPSSKRSLRWLFCCRTRNAVGIKVALRKPQSTTTWTHSILTNLCFLKTVASSDVRCGTVMPCNAAPPLKHYEIKSPRKLQSEPVDTTTFLPRGFLRRELFSSSETVTTVYKEVEEKTGEEIRSRRHNSLSFNTWMKGNSTDQRVHDSSNMNTSTSFHKIQGSGSSRRVQHLGSKYASVCKSDSMRLR